jgi:hypothetical protein
MSTFQARDTVGQVVTSRPALFRYFEKAGIDLLRRKKDLARSLPRERIGSPIIA